MPELVETVERLLFEGESESLDFKSEPYKVTNATPNEKSELVKDVLAFANSWRRTDAYILVGIREVRGGRGEVLGVEEILDDASIQQLVNSKVQRPISFSCRTVVLEGKTVDVIHIPVQERPFYLRRDFGKLKAEVVYIRRSSSTDRAKPDEVARMGGSVGDVYVSPELQLSLFDSNRLNVGSSVDLWCMHHQFDDKDVPDYVGSTPYNFAPVNRHYYREIVDFVYFNCSVTEFYVGVESRSEFVVRDLRLEIEVPPDSELTFYDLSHQPIEPDLDIDIKTFAMPPIGRGRDTSVEQVAGNQVVSCSLGKVQPKASVIARDPLFVAASESGEYELVGKAFSDDLREPMEVKFSFVADCEHDKRSLDEFIKIYRDNFLGSPKS